MKNITCYDRLIELFKLLGSDYYGDPFVKGEVDAYCYALHLIKDKLENIFSETLYENMSGIGARMLCSMLHLSFASDENKKRENIIKRLSCDFGNYEDGMLEEYITFVDENLSAQTENFVMAISGASAKNNDILYKIGEYFKSFLPPFIVADFGGDGLEFDYWDSAEYTFDEYDNFDLSFNFLETLK